MWLLLSALAFAQAQDWSEITLHTSTPVVVFVDDDPVGVTHPLDPLEVTVEPGEHYIRIQGVLGKHLGEERIELPPATHTEAYWRSKSLRFAEPWPLPGGAPAEEEPLPVTESADDSSWDEVLEPDAPLAIPASVPAAPAPPRDPDDFPVAEAPIAAVQDPVELPPEAPEPPVVAAPLEEPAPPAALPIEPALAPAEAAAPQTMRLEATEGTDLEIWHGEQVLRIQVRDGALVLTQSKSED